MLKLASWIILFYQFFIGILMVKFVDWLVRPFCTNPIWRRIPRVHYLVVHSLVAKGGKPIGIPVLWILFWKIFDRY